MDPVFVCVRSCVYMLYPFDLRFCLSATIVVLVCCSNGALARRLPDRILKLVLSGSSEGGAMSATRLRLALMLCSRYQMVY